MAVAAGKDCKAKGIIGSVLFLVERGSYDYEAKTYPILHAEAVIVDGKKIKEDTFYKLENGKVVEAD